MIPEIITFFLIGLTGGFGHCVLMCHPFVIYITGKYAVSGSGYYFMLKPHISYNIGRIITYSFLGAIAGFFGSVVQYAGNFVHIQKLAAILGGIILIIFALFSLFNMAGSNIFKLNIMQYFKKIRFNSPFLTGIMLGFLPCGLSMGAIIGAATSGKVLNGAILTASFGFGTAIAMLLLAIFGNITIGYSKILKQIGSFLLLIMGCYFIYIGLSF